MYFGTIIMHRHDGVGVIEAQNGERIMFTELTAEFAMGEKVIFKQVRALGRTFARNIQRA